MPKSRRIYGIRTNYRLLNDFLSNLGELRRANKRKDIDNMFEKRIMLAVTEVNGCRMCSYFHTKEALKLGMPEQDIRNILSGELKCAPEEEHIALAFAQHYAETVGRYDEHAMERLVQIYGKSRARSILAYIRAIMVGNAQGNIAGAFRSRLCGRPEPGSSLFKELGVLVCDVFFIPFILLKSPIVHLIRRMKK